VPIASQLRPIPVGAVKDKLPDARLALTSRGTTPSRQLILARLHRVQNQHGLPMRTVHRLRRAFCTSWLRRGADLEVVRIVAGHEDLETTARYVHARVEDARQAMGWATGGKREAASI
jgi:site-specific recombinase XerD